MSTKRHALLLLVLPAAALAMSACLMPGGYSVSEWDPSLNPGDMDAGDTTGGTTEDGRTGGGGTGSQLVITPYNVTPLATLSSMNVYETDESGTALRTFGFSITDPDPETFSYAPGYPSCGTGGSVVGTPALWGNGGSFECVFPDGPASPVVAVAVQDDEGVSAVSSHGVDVRNVAPTTTMSPLNPSSAPEGSTQTIVYTISDPGVDTLSGVSTACGSNGSKVPASDVFTSLAGNFACVFPDGPSNTTVSAAATDSDGATGPAASRNIGVTNVAPTTTLSPTNTLGVAEGTTDTYSYTISDAGADTVGSVATSCGANAIKSDAVNTNVAGSFKCTFLDGPQTSTVSAAAIDSDGAIGAASTQNVDVANVAPVVTLGANTLTVNEGTTHTYTYTISDQGTDTVTSVATSCGDYGTKSAATNNNTGGSFSCTFPDGPADTMVSAAATDSDGAAGASATQTVHVDNVAPTVTLSGSNPTNVNEGSTEHTYSYAIADPGLDTVAGVTTDCGSGGSKVSSSDTYSSTSGSFKCTFADGPADTNASAAATDSDGAAGAAAIQTVHVNNVAPTLTAAGNQSSNEGDPHSFNLGSFTDPGADADWTVSVDWGDGATSSATQGGTGSLAAASHAYADDTPGPYTATVTVTDPDGDSDSRTFTVAVANVAPTITGFSASDAMVGVMVEAASSITATWSDPGADTYNGNYVFDNGTPNPNFRVGITSADTFTHTFVSSGCDKPVTVEIRDDDGGTASRSTTVSVGSAGFLAPISNERVVDNLNNGQVLPVRIEVLHCAGSPISGLAPTIEIVQGDQTSATEVGSVTVTATSPSPADTDGIMRESGGSYIYNLRIDLEPGSQYTIVIRPFGAGSSGSLRHVIVAN